MHLSNSSNNNNNKSKLYEHIINDKSNKVSYNHGSNVTNMRHLKNFIENYKYNNNPFVNTNYPIYNPMTTKNTNNNNNNNNKNTSTTISHLFTNVSDKMKSNNHQKPPAPFKNTSSTNKTTTTTIATTDNKHKYFDNSSNNRNNQHPILNNGFMKPQIVVGGNDTSFQNETSSSSSSSTSSSNSSFNNNNNTNINLNRRFSLNSNQNESNILDSQKARDAFYKSLRTVENKPSQTVVLNHQQQKQIINSKLQNNTSSSSTSSSTSTSSIQSSSHNQSNSSRSTTSCELKDLNLNGNDTKSLNRPYDFKNNFSNLVKIDTRFKSDSFDVNYNSTKNEESQNQLRLLEESQNRMRHFQELINQQKARHRETITSLLHRRQNLAHAKSNSFNFPSNSDKNLQTIEKITETIDDSNVDTNEEKLSNLIGENNVPLNNSTPNESLTSLKSITVTTPKELNQKFQTYNENNSILNNKTTTITTTVSTLTNKSTTNSQDLKFKIQNIINTAVETQTKQKNLINNSNPVQTTTTTTIKTITTNNLSNVIMPKNGIDQVEKDDDDNNYDQELDDDGDNDDDDYNELDQKDKKISKTTLLTSSDIYSSLSSASLAEESDSENDENSIPTTKTDKNDEDYVLDVHSMSDILSKYGYDYKYLFNETTIKKSDQNTSVIQPPLTLSLFANVPPTIKFITQDEKINQLPESLNRLCKWKMCAITPNIVKATISRSNFKLANGKHDWIGVWGSHMKPECFRAIREYQKINHLPGSFQIGRKDRLCRNLYHAQAIFGKQEYNFVPITYVLPQDYNLLKQEIETKNCKWIIKPPASARGQGIRVVNKIEQIPKKRACVVQKYLSNPYLIDGLKFDLRIYVYVTSYDPLRIYIFNNGLSRFASRKYSNSSKTIGDKFMHLTNFSINKTNKEYKSNDDENACVGHKWSLKALWAYLQKKGINTDKIWEQIKDLAIKTIICGDPHVNILVKTHLKRKYSVHELFGFDVILDENLKPWIVEVNISPSLNSSSPLDVSVKGQMICDLFNLAGFMLPDPREIAKQEGKKSYKKIPKFLHFNKSVLPQILSNDEKTKHQYFIQRQNDDKVMSSILDRLTPDDLRILIESEDEYNRRGSFIRIFPSSNSQKYLRLFETTRYYNLLLNEWVSRYRNNRDRAITLLNSYCQKNIHIQNPSRQAENCWSSLPEANK